MRKDKKAIVNRPKKEKKGHIKTIFLIVLLTLFFSSFAVTAYIIINANQLTFKITDQDIEAFETRITELEDQVAEKDLLIEELTLRNSSATSSPTPTPPPSSTPRPTQGSGSSAVTSTQRPSASPSGSPSPTSSPTASSSPRPSSSPQTSASASPTPTASTRPTSSPSAAPTPSAVPQN